MHLGVKVVGSISKDIKAFKKKLKTSTTRGARDGGKILKTRLREQVTRAGLGQRLSKTWRVNVYPQSGVSADAAAVAFSKAPHIIYSFDRGVTIRGRRRKFLAIPTREAISTFGKGKNVAVTPENFEKKTGLKLFFIERRGRNPILIARGARLTRGGRVRALTVRKATKRLGERTNLAGQVNIAMFVLVPSVSLRKRFSVESAIPPAQAAFVRGIDRNLSSR